MEEFSTQSVKKMSESIAGKIIKSAEIVYVYGDNFFVINFTDGKKLSIRYDYIYDYDLTLRK
jgi:hypothetical protein